MSDLFSGIFCWCAEDKWAWSEDDDDEIADDVMTDDEDDEMINEVGVAEVRLGVAILEMGAVSEMVEFSS